MWTCPTELNEALPNISTDQLVVVTRDVAWWVLSQVQMSRPVVWTAEGTCGAERDLVLRKDFETLELLYAACEQAEVIQGSNEYGDAITPTFSLVS